MLQAITLRGANARSYTEAHCYLEDWVPQCPSARHMETLTEQIGEELRRQRDELAELWEKGKLPAPVCSPRAVAVSTDDGKIQVRAEDAAPGVHGREWKNIKVASLMTLVSQSHPQDPQPEPPRCFTEKREVEKLVRGLGHSGETPAEAAPRPLPTDPETPPGEPELKRAEVHPKVLTRSCVVTHTDPERFGAMVAAEAWGRGFFRTPLALAVFLGDGSPTNWTLQDMYFPGWMALLDFIHLLEHLVSAAQAVKGDAYWPLYLELLGFAWKGQVEGLLHRLREEARRLGPPPEGASSNDPRHILLRGIHYIETNKTRMNYPEARKRGLPITTSYVESLVGQFNLRVKAKNKFWCPWQVEAVLQVRAAFLSTTPRWVDFWEGRPSRLLGRIRPRLRRTG